VDRGSPEFIRLVGQVRRRAAADDPAALLDAAVAVGAEHAANADRLLDHFVVLARGAGMSWTEIGGRLGVSKQAARQRFLDVTPGRSLPGPARTAQRLQRCLDEAGEQARIEGAPEIGTEHLLIGLLTDGVAAAILGRLGVRTDAVRDASRRLFGPAAETPAAAVPSMSREARCALDTAAHAAATAPEPGEVDTEHLLAALALDPAGRARRVLNQLEVDVVTLKRELQRFVTVSSAKPARWWKRRPSARDSCTFCGRPDTGELVQGPGVAICRNCVDLATDILDSRQPTR
jgi:hypothetical protein